MFRWSPPGTIDNCAPSRFQAEVDPGKCIGAKECLDECLFNAISIKENVQGKSSAFVDAEKCMGCGNCVLKCSSGAIQMKLVRPPEFVPDKYVGIF